MRAALGILRSVVTYRLSRSHRRGLEDIYRPFARRGGLAFDIGAHVGDRVRAFRALGMEVVAVEPQPAAMRALRLLHGRDPGVRLVSAAAGPRDGRAAFRVNTANPTVSTLSERFVSATRGAPGWDGQSWDASIEVETLTLDTLIARYGMPDFIKIDVEGAEAEVLAGLTVPPPALSFEIVTAARAAAYEALAAARALGYAEFRLSLGESHRFDTDWQDGAAMERTLAVLPEEANSGDVYARPRQGLDPRRAMPHVGD